MFMNFIPKGHFEPLTKTCKSMLISICLYILKKNELIWSFFKICFKTKFGAFVSIIYCFFLI